MSFSAFRLIQHWPLPLKLILLLPSITPLLFSTLPLMLLLRIEPPDALRQRRRCAEASDAFRHAPAIAADAIRLSDAWLHFAASVSPSHYADTSIFDANISFFRFDIIRLKMAILRHRYCRLLDTTSLIEYCPPLPPLPIRH
jgi:hypothetical protein